MFYPDFQPSKCIETHIKGSSPIATALRNRFAFILTVAKLSSLAKTVQYPFIVSVHYAV